MFCTDIPAPFLLIFSSTVPQLLYYSHVPTALVALILGTFVYYKNRQALDAKLLLAIVITFFLWSVADLILWTNVDSRIIMFVWSFVNLLEMMVSAFTLYFSYVFIEGKDAPLRFKIYFGSLLAVFMFFIPTVFNIPGFNLPNCEAQQGPLLNYFYALEGLFSLVLITYLLRKIIILKGEERKEAAYFSAGVVLFLASFSGANILGSVLEKWEILQYGLFGMPIFMGFLAYLIVKYKAFNIKLISAQALIAALVILVGSQFFFVKNLTNQILTGVTLLLVAVFGWMLIRSVMMEVQRKEELQKMADKLALANDKLRKLDNAKSEFISIASHQLRTPLTAIKGFISMILEGSYGVVTDEQKDVLNKVYLSNERLINLVEDLLNLSRIESGRMEYNFEKVNLKDVCQEIFDTFVVRAKERDLKLDFDASTVSIPEVTTDRNKVREVISNLVDNAVKYTPKGWVSIRLISKGDFVRVAVTDTGIGVPKEEIPYLFQKFSRGKDITRLNASGTGIGLHVGKKMIESMGGKIWVESEGDGKGSTFFVEVPIEFKGESEMNG